MTGCRFGKRPASSTSRHEPASIGYVIRPLTDPTASRLTLGPPDHRSYDGPLEPQHGPNSGDVL